MRLLTAGAMFIFMYFAEISRDTNNVAYWMAFTGVFTCSVYLLLPATSRLANQFGERG